MECKQEENLANCNCTYEPCSRKGLCCECISYHLRMRELPACCFPDDVERTFNRSFELFAQLVSDGRI
ncbi:MAG: cytosolic protein [Anaerolineales bacterium]|nr:MAG: cytosolic protein [Anaerolineales bacterium]